MKHKKYKDFVEEISGNNPGTGQTTTHPKGGIDLEPAGSGPIMKFKRRKKKEDD